MATTTFSNVITLQPGGPRVTAMANRILLECRDLAARRLREGLREMLQKTGDSLLQRADVAVASDDRRTLLALNDALREKGGRLEGLLAAHWAREFDSALKGAPAATGSGELLLEDMQIVDYGEMDEELALKALARRLDNKYEGEIYALGRRLNHLIGKEKDDEAVTPATPEVLTKALQNTLREADFDTKTRLELYRFFEPLVEGHLGPVYHALNAHLVQQRILPDVRRDYGRAGSHTAAKQTLKEKATGDMFAMLQQLVSGTKGAATNVPGQMATGAPAGAQSGSNPTGSLEAMLGTPGISVPPAHVWASLEALQHAPAPSPAQLPAAAVGHANLLYDFRASEAGQSLGQLDAITVDIVAMLFDMIFDDREISDPIKALVGKLQIPVLKVAMLDRSFFSSKAHPTRRLLDLISRAALRWGHEVGRDDPLYCKIAEVIDHLHDNFKQDTALFGTLCEQLERFLAEYEESESGKVTRAALLVVQRELDELADMAVDSEIQSLLNSQLPPSVADLLDHEWRTLLKRIHLEEGPDSKVWESALTTACDLIASVRPKNDIQERQALARQLPVLIKQLSTGFDRVGVDGERRRALLDSLFPLHAAALRGTEPPPSAVTEPVASPPVISEPVVTSQALGDGEVTVESISLTSPISAPPASGDVEHLQRGDWIEYPQADGSSIRYRLSWISPQRGIFLFTNPQSPNALAVSPEAMSLQLARGEVRIVPTEPIFDRALTRTIDILQAA